MAPACDNMISKQCRNSKSRLVHRGIDEAISKTSQAQYSPENVIITG